jgi:hypothetical protein
VTEIPAENLGISVAPSGKAEILLPAGMLPDSKMSDLWVAIIATVLDLQNNPERAAAVAAQWMKAN